MAGICLVIRGSMQYQQAQIAQFPPQMSTFGRVVPLEEQEEPNAQILTLEVKSFCRAVLRDADENGIET